MTTGFRNRSTANNTLFQLDNSYANFAMMAKGSGSVSGINAGGYREVTIDIPAPHPATAIALRGNTQAVGIMQMTYINFAIRCKIVTWFAGGAVPTFEWFTFVPAGAANPTSNIGLKLRDPAGRTVSYDSTLRYTKVLGVIDTLAVNGTDIFVPPYAGSFAALYPGPYWQSEVVIYPEGNFYTREESVNSSGVYVYNGGLRAMDVPLMLSITSTGPGRSTSNWYGNNVFPVVDVTGF